MGFDGHVGPWNVTPSVYSMMLINTASTVKNGALYPAKPYHEDVDFAWLCEERQLVMVKCNWLYFHKVAHIMLSSTAQLLQHAALACISIVSLSTLQTSLHWP